MPQEIEVVPQTNGFYVYGRFSSVMRANLQKEILYCNIIPGSDDRIAMEQALLDFDATKMTRN